MLSCLTVLYLYPLPLYPLPITPLPLTLYPTPYTLCLYRYALSFTLHLFTLCPSPVYPSPFYPSPLTPRPCLCLYPYLHLYLSICLALTLYSYLASKHGNKASRVFGVQPARQPVRANSDEAHVLGHGQDLLLAAEALALLGECGDVLCLRAVADQGDRV